jgi:PAS domain-containing protein
LFQQVTREIEERKRTEEAVRKSEEKYRQLFNSIRDALLITDTRDLLLTAILHSRRYSVIP